MKKRFLFLFLAAGIVLMNACQKEKSYEGGLTLSEGLLQDDGGGDCLPKTVAGVYVAGIALVGTANYIDVQVNVTKTGTYTIYTDTVNGIYFRVTGVFTTTGMNTVRLKGIGTPSAPGIHNFVVRYNTSGCTISVTTSGSLAAFTLNGSPGVCMNAAVAGTYLAGSALNASNTVTINVNVTTAGAFAISTIASNGMIFSGSGTFTTTGAQAIVLTGSGIPAAAGSTNVPVTAGSSSCSFTLDVVSGAAFIINCGSATVNGTYTVGVPLDATNTATISVNVTTTGGYSISGTANGMTFSASGNFAATGPQLVILTGTGIPVAAGTFTVPVPAATTPCSFSVTTNPGAAIDWKFTEGGTTTFQGAIVDASLQVVTLPPPVSLTVTNFVYDGDNPAGDIITLGLIDVAGGIQANETYSTSATATNAAAFAFDNAAGTISYTADPNTAGVTLIFKVTSHNTATKTISGTFSGTVKDAANVTKTISNGTFQATYP
jgi:hypothetical protein